MNNQAIHHHDVLELVSPAPVVRPPDVMAVHRDEIFRNGLESLLSTMPGVGCVFVTDSGSRACMALANSRPDVVLLPASLPSSEMNQLLRDARELDVKTLLMLNSLHRECIRRVSRLPVDGFLLETGLSADSLAQALKAVVRGEIPVPPSLVRELLSEVKHGGRRDSGPQLTPREMATLTLLVEGMSNKQIARRLSISEHGAKRHVSNVLAKLNCPNRTVAAVVAVQDGLLPAPEC